MTVLIISLFAVSIISDVAVHLCFKYATTVSPESLLENEQLSLTNRILAFCQWLIASPWIIIGVIIGIVDIIVWLYLLEEVPLSVAYPIVSLHYCGVVIASWLILGETVSARQWWGTVLITLGVAIVGLTGT